jgi:hypothetical protein
MNAATHECVPIRQFSCSIRGKQPICLSALETKFIVASALDSAILLPLLWGRRHYNQITGNRYHANRTHCHARTNQSVSRRSPQDFERDGLGRVLERGVEAGVAGSGRVRACSRQVFAVGLTPRLHLIVSPVCESIRAAALLAAAFLFCP